MRVALYLRVSTALEQTTENQRLALEAVAAKRGWQIVAVYEDKITGWKGRDKRPGFNAMLKDATRSKYDMVMAWAVDRLGRSLQNLVEFLADLHSANVGLYLHEQSLDTSTPSGRAMFQMCGVFAEFERSMIVARVHAGLARAKAEGKTLGRPRTSTMVEDKIRDLRKSGLGMAKIARELRISVGVVHRTLTSPAA